MNKKILLVFLALVMVISLAAFGACKKEEQAPPVEEVWQWPQTLPIMSGAVGGVAYAAALAWGTPLADDTGMKVRVVSVESGVVQRRYLAEGRFFAAVLGPTDQQLRVITQDMAERDMGAKQWREVYAFSKVNMGFALRGDSDIKSPYDLKGKKVGWISTWGEPAKNLARALLRWGNISDDEVTWVPLAGAADCGPAIRDGRVDVVFDNSTSSPWWYEVEASPGGLKWMNLDAKKDPEAAVRFEKVFPASVVWGTVDGGVPSSLGVKSLIGLSAYETIATYDEETVYHVVKWLHENYDRFKDANPACRSMTIDNFMALAETSFLPIHEGTVRYLKELGMWTDAHETRQQQNIALLTKWEDAYQTAIGMADDKGIPVNAKSDAWFELWSKYRDSLPYPAFKQFRGLD